MKNKEYRVIGTFMCKGEKYVTVRFTNAAMSMPKNEWIKMWNMMKR